MDSVCLAWTQPCSSCTDLAPTLLQAQPVFLEAAFTSESEFTSLSCLLQGQKRLLFISTVIPDEQECLCDCDWSPFPPLPEGLSWEIHSRQDVCLHPPACVWLQQEAWPPLTSPLSIPPPPPPHSPPPRHGNIDIHGREWWQKGDVLAVLEVFLKFLFPTRNSGTKEKQAPDV